MIVREPRGQAGGGSAGKQQLLKRVAVPGSFQRLAVGTLLRAALAAAVVTAVVGWATLPEAQAETGGSEKLRAVRQAMEQGQAQFLAGKLESAAKTFDEAWAAHHYSAFLFNAGIAYQKLGQLETARARFAAYLAENPSGPDAAAVKARIAALDSAIGSAGTGAGGAGPGGAGGSGGDSGGAATAGGSGGGLPAPIPSGPSVAPTAAPEQMKSLVVVETVPAGAPVRIYRRIRDSAADFTGPNVPPGWEEQPAGRSPLSLPLDVGRYHVVVEKFRDFRATTTSVDVSAGRVFQIRAILSQGAFLAFLRVNSNVRGAAIYLQEAGGARKEWGDTPHGEPLPAGAWTLFVEAPGFEPFRRSLTLEHGEQSELDVKLVRASWGVLELDGNAPRMRVAIDGEPVGVWERSQPPLGVKVRAGKHRLTAAADGFKAFEGEIVVPLGRVQPVRVKLEPAPTKVGAWTQAVLAAAFLGGATFVGVESNRLHSELDDERRAGRLDPDDSRINRGRWYAVGADGGFALGGLFALLATYNFLRDPTPPSARFLGPVREPEDTRAKRPTASRAPNRPSAANAGVVAAPFGAPGGGGLTLGGRF